MTDRANDLNYDYNYNVFMAKTLLSNLNFGDKQRVIKWIQKLSSCNETVEEMTIRNNFMFHLVIGVQNGVLEEPFNENPPSGVLSSISHLLPRGAEEVQNPAADLGEPAPRRPQVYAQSPDGGAFLAAQPVPKCGAFCYLAVVCKPKNP